MNAFDYLKKIAMREDKLWEGVSNALLEADAIEKRIAFLKKEQRILSTKVSILRGDVFSLETQQRNKSDKV
jgi:hypothetical protein